MLRILKCHEYNTGGHTLINDDFCVENDSWNTIGKALMVEIKSIATQKGVSQVIVVSGDHDIAKEKFLEDSGLCPASIWFVGGIYP